MIPSVVVIILFLSFLVLLLAYESLTNTVFPGFELYIMVLTLAQLTSFFHSVRFLRFIHISTHSCIWCPHCSKEVHCANRFYLLCCWLPFPFLFVLIFSMPETECRAMSMISQCSPTGQYPQPPSFFLVADKSCSRQEHSCTFPGAHACGFF